MPKINKGRLTLKIVTIMKVDNTNLTILFIDFHRLPLSINKNHLIATDFYHYSGQNTKQVTQDTSKINTYLTVTNAIFRCPWKHSKIAHLYIS